MKKFKVTPVYRTENVGNEKFRTSCWIGDKCLGNGLGNSKKEAEKKCAKKILIKEFEKDL